MAGLGRHKTSAGIESAISRQIIRFKQPNNPRGQAKQPNNWTVQRQRQVAGRSCCSVARASPIAARPSVLPVTLLGVFALQAIGEGFRRDWWAFS
jgi:hypothetical protein